VSELSRLLGTAGPPHQLNHEGRVFTFHLLTQDRKNAFEKRLYQTAREGVYVDREHMTSDEYLKRLDEVRERYELGEYGLFGRRGAKVLETPAGAMLLLEILTGESQDDLAPLLAARAEEVKVLVKTVMTESFRKVRPKPPEAPGG
jgi:hypothetical protein